MTNHETKALEQNAPTSEINIGTPVEWMVDPDKATIVLGVTYAFSLTGERKTVWYTANKQRAKRVLFVTQLPTEMC
jgi:hypothetical protein